MAPSRGHAVFAQGEPDFARRRADCRLRNSPSRVELARHREKPFHER
jgi:hypothetical protein